MIPVTLDAVDAIELAELLECLSEWLASGDGIAGLSDTHYGIDDWQGDLARFRSLLLGEHGTQR